MSYSFKMSYFSTRFASGSLQILLIFQVVIAKNQPFTLLGIKKQLFLVSVLCANIIKSEYACYIVKVHHTFCTISHSIEYKNIEIMKLLELDWSVEG